MALLGVVVHAFMIPSNGEISSPLDLKWVLKHLQGLQVQMFDELNGISLHFCLSWEQAVLQSVWKRARHTIWLVTSWRLLQDPDLN